MLKYVTYWGTYFIQFFDIITYKSTFGSDYTLVNYLLPCISRVHFTSRTRINNLVLFSQCLSKYHALISLQKNGRNITIR